ncbi:putative F-box/FBD/LRR-repeat protein [Glycine max]|nr:putative F-box/FBD/LRR-repeat protein [Glycine max]
MQPLDYSSMDFITQVLSIRDKYSDIRVLCFRARLSFSRLNSLIRRAIRHNVRELDIEASTVCTDDYFNFPRCGFEAKIRVSFASFIGYETHDFQYLQTLSLSLVILNNQPSLPDLDISCTKLERMRLTNGKSWVKINAPKLEHLCWQHNAITDIISNFIILSNNHLLIQPFYNLKHLELHTGFNRSNVPGLILLFKSSRTLNTLILKIIHEYRIERKLWSHIYKALHNLSKLFVDFPLDQEWNRDLWGMTITEGEKSERVFSTTLGSAAKFMNVALAKFLPKHGKALEEMILHTGHCNARDTLRRQMMGFSWASSNAKVAFQ